MRSDKYQILHMSPNFLIEGGQVLLLNTLQAGNSRLFKHHVAVPWKKAEEPLRKEFTAIDVNTIVLNLRRSLLPLIILRLVFYVLRNRIDLIHTNTTKWDTRIGLIVGRMTGRPVINTFHTMRYPNTLREKEWSRFRGVVSAVVAVSTPVAQEWESCIQALGVASSNVRLIYPGVKSRFLQPVSETALNELRTELKVHPDREKFGPVLTIVARLVDGKGHEYLPHVLTTLVRKHPHLQLLVVGEGPLRQEIEKSFQAAGVSDHVTMLGKRRDVPEILAISDLFIFPSRGEGFGMSVLEAMAMGVPVVAFDIPALRDFFKDGKYGNLIELGSAEKLAESAATILGDTAVHDAMSRSARDAASNFTIGNTAKVLEELWLEVIDKK